MGNNNDETESMQLNTHRLKKERKKKHTTIDSEGEEGRNEGIGSHRQSLDGASA